MVNIRINQTFSTGAVRKPHLPDRGKMFIYFLVYQYFGRKIGKVARSTRQVHFFAEKLTKILIFLKKYEKIEKIRKFYGFFLIFLLFFVFLLDIIR